MLEAEADLSDDEQHSWSVPQTAYFHALTGTGGSAVRVLGDVLVWSSRQGRRLLPRTGGAGRVLLPPSRSAHASGAERHSGELGGGDGGGTIDVNPPTGEEHGGVEVVQS